MTLAHNTNLLNQLHKKNNTSFEHSIRVAYLSLLIGIEMNLTSEELQELKISGLYHDIGKLHISNRLLDKEETLTEDEYEQMKNHTIIGCGILPDIEENDKIKEAALLHHERLDGSGYPLGITNIPLFPRIIAVADTFDAMTNQRPYNRPTDDLLALMELRKKAKLRVDIDGTKHQLYDPDIVECFIKAYVKEFVTNKTNYIDEEYMVLRKKRKDN